MVYFLFNNPLAMAWLLMVAVTAVAAVLDIRKFSVPNWLTLPLCPLGLIYHGVWFGHAGLAFSATGLVVGFLLLLALFLIGAMGAGDVKLLAAVGAWLGPANAIWICLIACIAAGFYSLGVYAMRGRFGRLMTPFGGLDHNSDTPSGRAREERVSTCNTSSLARPLGVLSLLATAGVMILAPFGAILVRFRSPRSQTAEAQAVDVVTRRDDRRWRVLPFALMIAIGVLIAATGEYGVPFLRLW